MLGASILEWIQYVGCWKVYMSRHICHIGCHLLRWASWGEGTNSLYHVFHMGISHSCYIADGMINFTQSAIIEYPALQLHVLHPSCTYYTVSAPPVPYLHLLHLICTTCTLSAPPAPYLHHLHHICTSCMLSAPPAPYLHYICTSCTICTSPAPSAPPALPAVQLHFAWTCRWNLYVSLKF